MHGLCKTLLPPKTRRMQIAFIAAFFAMVALPLAQMLVPFVDVRPITENRVPAPLPNFTAKILHGDGRVATDLNRWFDDRVGFRSFFIRLHNQIDYSLFNHSDKVYIGRDGTLFLRSYLDAKVSHERAGEAWLQGLQAQFLALARYLDRRNIRLVIVSNPISATVYPELLPPDAPRFPGVTQFDDLRRFLRETNQWSYVDGQDVMAHCGPYRKFYRTDLHTTTPASFCIAQAIVSRIAVAEHQHASFWNPNFTYHPQPNFSGGNLTNVMSTLVGAVETIDVAESLYVLGQPVPEGSFEQDPRNFFETIYRAREPFANGKLPAMVLYGNSFVDPYLHSGLYFQFTEVYRVRSNMISIDAMLANMPRSTRYVTVQFLEAFLSEFLNYRIPND